MRGRVYILSVLLILLNTYTFAGGFYKLFWYDEFNGTTLNDSKWSYQMGRGENGNANWGNNEQQFYTNTTSNVFVENGMLTIRGKREKYTGWNPNWGGGGRTESADYTSGRILTREKFFTTYGRIEARISLPVEQGLWPAFWMMPEKSEYGGWAASGEIDIMEAKGRLPAQYSGAIHYGGPWPRNTYATTGYYPFPSNKTIGDFHVYAVEWKEGEIKWLCDDQVVYVRNASNGGWWSENGAFPAPFDKDFHIILNLAIGGNFDENIVSSASWQSGDMKVDYVRVYKWDDNLTEKEIPEDGGGASKPQINNARIGIKQLENEIYISSPEVIQSAELYSIKGQLVYAQSNNTIPTVGISKGIYVLKVVGSNGNQQMFKVIK